MGIETSSLGGSVALVEEGAVVAERRLAEGQRSAQSLLPAIDLLMKDVGRPLAAVKVIGVTVGPGSFTGLRVGVTAAKTLAYALGAQTVGVDTLDVIAAQASGHSGRPQQSGRLHVVMDAQRRELFAASFGRQDEAGWVREISTSIVPATTWQDLLEAGDLVAGPAAGRMAKQIGPDVAVMPDLVNEPQAATVALLAAEAFRRGKVDDFWKLAPAYYRPSAAEEKAKLHASE